MKDYKPKWPTTTIEEYKPANCGCALGVVATSIVASVIVLLVLVALLSYTSDEAVRCLIH